MSCQPPMEYANPRDLGQVQAPLRDRLWTAMQDAPRGGLILVSGRRTDYQQWLLRHDRCPGRECDPGCKGSPTTARPGRSNHRNISSKIAAADMGGIDLNWLGQHESDYGIARVVPGEKWHFEVVANPKVKINRYGTAGNPNEGHHWVTFGPGDFDGVRGPIYKRGGYDNQVAEFQIRLKKLHEQGWKGCDPGAIDGVFGNTRSNTSKASTAFHANVVALQKLTGQEVWPKSEPFVGPRKIAMLRWWSA